MTKEKSKPSKEQCLLIPRERVGEEQRNKRSTIYQKSNRNWYSGLVRYRIISNSFCTATSPITYTYACTYTQRAEENEKADDISIKRWIFPTCTTERERLRIKRSANTMLKLRYRERKKTKASHRGAPCMDTIYTQKTTGERMEYEYIFMKVNSSKQTDFSHLFMRIRNSTFFSRFFIFIS